jgi:hypothetical protein
MARNPETTETAKTDKAGKFIELANKRGGKAVKAIETIGSLANKRNYDFDQAQADKIVGALQGKVDALKKAFDDALAGKATAATGNADIL